MASCYDCIHCGACSDAGDSGFSSLKEDASECQHYKNKEDVVEVVRCKDCELYTGRYCLLTDDTEDRREPDDYCSYGERIGE